MTNEQVLIGLQDLLLEVGNSPAIHFALTEAVVTIEAEIRRETEEAAARDILQHGVGPRVVPLRITMPMAQQIVEIASALEALEIENKSLRERVASEVIPDTPSTEGLVTHEVFRLAGENEQLRAQNATLTENLAALRRAQQARS